MPNSLLDTACLEKTLRRIASIPPQQVPRWGTMNATQMLQHCRIVNDLVKTGRSTPRSPTLKEHILRTLVIHITQRVPKGVTTTQRVTEATAREAVHDFEAERQRLIASIKDLHEYKEPIQAIHPLFGPLSTKEWGMFAWIHLNHHLRQFGV